MSLKSILDIGGEGVLQERGRLSILPKHPLWGNDAWFTLNISESKIPDIIGDAISLNNINDASVDGIYSSHTIEHINIDQSKPMFSNWLRVLKPDGRVEIRCPDIEWAWGEYFLGNLPEELLTELMMGIRVGTYEHHLNMWWESKLIGELEAVGFVDVRRINWGFNIPYLDHWPYDGKYSEHHGFEIIDLLIEGYKKPAATENGKKNLIIDRDIPKKQSHRRIPGVSPYLNKFKARRQEKWALDQLQKIVKV